MRCPPPHRGRGSCGWQDSLEATPTRTLNVFLLEKHFIHGYEVIRTPFMAVAARVGKQKKNPMTRRVCSNFCDSDGITARTPLSRGTVTHTMSAVVTYSLPAAAALATDFRVREGSSSTKWRFPKLKKWRFSDGKERERLFWGCVRRTRRMSQERFHKRKRKPNRERSTKTSACSGAFS